MSETESTTQRIGQLLKARYRIERVLHTGEHAHVYAGTDTRVDSHARVAIKLLLAERATHDRLLRQAYLANAVGHPGVVTVLDAGTTEEGAAFLIMELLTAPSLASLRAEYGGKLPLRLACAIADQCLDVLACAHPQAIFHGALTPEQLFWARGSQLKVLGFGALAQQLASAADEADAARARNADLSAVAGLWHWLLGHDTAAVSGIPQSLLAVFDKAQSGGWPSAESMRRALSRAHRVELGSRIDAGLQPTAAGGGGLGVDAPLSWLWIWLAATGLAIGLLALSSLVSEPEYAARPRPDASPLPEADALAAGEAQADLPAVDRDGDSPARRRPDAATSEQASEAQEDDARELAPADNQEHGAAPARVIPRGPSLKALQVPMLGRGGDTVRLRNGLMPVATAHRLCTDLAARRREEPLSDSEQRAWDEHCQKH